MCTELASEVTQVFFLLYCGRIRGLGLKKEKEKEKERKRENNLLERVKRWHSIQMDAAGQTFIVH